MAADRSRHARHGRRRRLRRRARSIVRVIDRELRHLGTGAGAPA